VFHRTPVLVLGIGIGIGQYYWVLGALFGIVLTLLLCGLTELVLTKQDVYKMHINYYIILGKVKLLIYFVIYSSHFEVNISEIKKNS